MADDVDRKEKVAAGLKKLKQFQRRSATKKATKRHSSGDWQPEISGQEEVAVQETEKAAKESCATRVPQPPEFHPLAARSCEDLTQLRDECKSAANVLSPSESLRQITLQIHGLMNNTSAALNGDVSALTEGSATHESLLLRNRELASNLSALRHEKDQLEFQVQQLKAKLTRQQNEFERQLEERHEQTRREQGAVSDQLQVHIQTIGILVAEKTELQSALNQMQQTAKQKAVETEELQGRLKALRERNADMERRLSSVSNHSQAQEKSTKEHIKEIDRLKMDHYRSSKAMEELKQKVDELTNKLEEKVKANEDMQQELTEAKKQLSLTQLYAKQLSGRDPEDTRDRLEQLHNEKLLLEKKVDEYRDALEKMSLEKQQLSAQYQSFADRLSQQADGHRARVEQLIGEKEALEKTVAELESKEQVCMPAPQDEELVQKLVQYEQELANVKSLYDAQVQDNQQMSALLAEREAQAEALEVQLKRIQDDHVESSTLLEALQSDKVAASRALTQNRELKRQLEELQDTFVKLSNDKLELTEQLQKEQHVTKELGERLGQQEEEMRDLRDQLAAKEGKVHDLEEQTTKEMYQQSQLADRVRHYQAQCQLTDILQQELSQAQERINALVTQNSDLRKALADRAQLAVDVNEKDTGKVHDLVASLSASVQQLELERNQLMHQMDEQKVQREALQGQLQEFQKVEDIANYEGEEVSKEAFLKLKVAMQRLEERFKKTMDQIADLTDQKQQLEHLVTQLQGETDTIADYIALYQVQRGIMRKRAAEKDDYISQLAKDREELKAKLAELQCLIVRLLDERQQLENASQPLPGRALTVSTLSEAASAMSRKSHTKDSGDTAAIVNGEPQSQQNEETAQKIMTLLSEIGTSTVVDGSPVPDTFHPCPVCSGRLLTV
ncbi:golgin subfamily A member 2-like [Ornithodoros turicata]|uniref:golgin subfamily A member 2-like n=1 Tax=Ornithodoros turicata TaxID=34597 RepID=UPI0031399B22